MTCPVIIAHARGFIPAHLAGRGVTVWTLFGIGRVGILQTVSGQFKTQVESARGVAFCYMALFELLGMPPLGNVNYLFGRDAAHA